jgi:hypothetical protein
MQKIYLKHFTGDADTAHLYEHLLSRRFHEAAWRKFGGALGAYGWAQFETIGDVIFAKCDSYAQPFEKIFNDVLNDVGEIEPADIDHELSRIAAESRVIIKVDKAKILDELKRLSEQRFQKLDDGQVLHRFTPPQNHNKAIWHERKILREFENIAVDVSMEKVNDNELAIFLLLRLIIADCIDTYLRLNFDFYRQGDTPIYPDDDNENYKFSVGFTAEKGKYSDQMLSKLQQQIRQIHWRDHAAALQDFLRDFLADSAKSHSLVGFFRDSNLLVSSDVISDLWIVDNIQTIWDKLKLTIYCNN